MMSFCENRTLCRRVVIMERFGEAFKAENCQKMCDNCRNPAHSMAIECYQFLDSIFPEIKNQITFNQLCDLLKGSNNKKCQKNTSAIKGLLKDWKKDKVEAFLKSLIFQGVFIERIKEVK